MLKTIATLFAALLLISGLLLLFRRGGPARALSRAQAVRLLEDVLAGRARDAHWLLFMSLPIRDDPVLLELRVRCADIEQRHFCGEGTHRAPFIFRRDGLVELATLLRWLHGHTDQRLL